MQEYSRNGVLAITASVERYSPRQNLLVGRREIGTFSEAGKVVGSLHGLAGRRYSRVNQRPVRQKQAEPIDSVRRHWHNSCFQI